MSQELTRFTNAQQFGTFFESHRGEFLSVAPPEFDVEKLRQIVFMNVTRNPDLRKCTPDTWLVALMQAAETGLIPGGVTSEAYLIPYGSECQFSISYKGLITLMKRYGEVRDVKAVCVYKGDRFEVQEGLHPDLIHAPRFLTRDPDDITHAYAIALLKSGERKFELLTREDIESRRKRSKAQKSSPWQTDYAAMACKSAIRQLARTMDLSPKLNLFLKRDEGESPLPSPVSWDEAPASVSSSRPSPKASAMPVNDSTETCPACHAPPGSRHTRTCAVGLAAIEEGDRQRQEEPTQEAPVEGALLDVPAASDLAAIKR